MQKPMNCIFFILMQNKTEHALCFVFFSRLVSFVLAVPYAYQYDATAKQAIGGKYRQIFALKTKAYLKTLKYETFRQRNM